MTLFRKQFSHPEMENKKIKISTDRGEELTIRPLRPTILTEEIGSWDDAEHIHNWFVRNVRGGVNEQGEVMVTRTQLTKLLEDVRQVVKQSQLIPSRSFFGRTFGRGAADDTSDGQLIVDTSVARKLLPVTNRFLGRKYDDQYMFDLHHTITMLLEALDAEPDTYYTYQASW